MFVKWIVSGIILSLVGVFAYSVFQDGWGIAAVVGLICVGVPLLKN